LKVLIQPGMMEMIETHQSTGYISGINKDWKVIGMCISLNMLKDDLLKNWVDIKINKVDESEYINTKSCASLYYVPNIDVLNTLIDSEYSQSVCHEFGHIAANWHGLISVRYNNDDLDLNPLIFNINNSIAHLWIINYLNNRSIPSDFHLNKLGLAIDTFEQDIEDLRLDRVRLHGLGVRLFDIYVTIPHLREQVSSKVVKNPDVKFSYRLAQKYLTNIVPELDQFKQFKAIKMFLKKLGYNPRHLKIRCY
jgi:hypothetical protein